MYIIVNKESSDSLIRQIYTQIKILILDGTLSPGEKLPSTRFLAKELNISRNTTVTVYDQLIAEGYLDGVSGSGTKVSLDVEEYCHMIDASNSLDPITNEIATATHTSLIDFCSGIPDLSVFPRKDFAYLYKNCIQEISCTSLQYQSPGGCLKLKVAISNYLLRTRGLHCDAARIMIVSGSTQGLSLISQLLYRSDQTVFMENPTHPGLRQVIQKAGYSITDISADHHGINPELFPQDIPVSYIYTTPSHQYPLGSVLSLKRRIALCKYALANNCYIIEDDYDSEFRYEGQPIQALYEMCPKKVIYIGSFSKILSPAIRLGYMILPDSLQESYFELKQHTDVHTEAITQYVLASFIEQGLLDRHVWKMKKIYAKKRMHLIHELHAHFGNAFKIKGDSAGLHIVLFFYKIIFNDGLIRKLLTEGIKIYPLQNYISSTNTNPKDTYQHEILLGYGHLTNAEITSGIQILYNVIYSQND